MTSTAPKTQTGTFYIQKKRLYSVIIFEEEDWITNSPIYSVYYQKVGYSMRSAFGLLREAVSLEQCFEVAWGNLPDYKDMFN